MKPSKAITNTDHHNDPEQLLGVVPLINELMPRVARPRPVTTRCHWPREHRMVWSSDNALSLFKVVDRMESLWDDGGGCRSDTRLSLNAKGKTMALQIGDVVQVTFLQRLFSQRILTVLHCRVQTPAGSSTAQEMIDMAAHMVNSTTAGRPLTLWKGVVTTQLQFDEVRAQPVFPLRQPYQKAAIGITGTLTDLNLTPNAAVSIEKRTLTPGRKGVGRIQMAGASFTQLTDGVWDSTYLTGVNLAFNNVVGQFTVAASGGVYVWCLYNPTSAGAKYSDLFDVQAQQTCRTMHRRTVGLGI